MGIIVIPTLSDGINVKSHPTNISDSGLQDCVGFDLTADGILESAGGLALNDIAAFLPVSGVQCMDIQYIGSDRYILATTHAGLYANGVLVKAGFTKRFKAVSSIGNIYLVNGTLAIRFDGTTCYQWGIEAPTSIPTITAGTYLTTLIDAFEDVTTWAANQVGCTIVDEAVIVKTGTKSMKVTVAASTIGYSFVPYTTDLTKFSTGENSSIKDYIRFRLYIDSLENLDMLGLWIDVGDGTYLSDYLYYTLVSPGLDKGMQNLGFGATSTVITEDTTREDIQSQPMVLPPGDTFGISSIGPFGPTSEQGTITVTKTITNNIVDPILRDQILSYWSRSNLFKIEAGVWLDIKIPKNLFIQNGDVLKGWDSISSIKLEVKATDAGAVVVYLDQMELAGGSDFIGEYQFGYSYARRDANNNILHESGAARANQLILFSDPIKFDREPLVYAARPLSGDPQVNAGILFGIGGSLSNLWILAQINDNTTVTDTLVGIGESTAERILRSINNEPAPAGTDLVTHQNKIWMVGDANYPRILRSSDILADGTLALEAWPGRNGYDLEGNTGNLTNIRLVNQVPVVKGDSGEWIIQVLDATDFLQVKAKKISSMGLIGPDAVVGFESSNIYPSHGGFVSSNGNQAQFVMPEVQPLIDDLMVSAIGVNAGLVSYFTYQSLLSGTRTAKIDLFRGNPRFSNINNYLLDWMVVDVKTNKVYVVKDGSVFLLDSGYADESTLSKELYAMMKSKAYQPGGLLSWNRMELIHNTGGRWFILDVYIDGILKASSLFKSDTRTVTNFRDFGPVSGYSFQFVISGNYTSKATIFLPIRIYHGGK